MFHATHSFVRQYIRIFIFQSGRFERAMKIDKQMMFGCFPGYPFVIVDHPLIASVHKINLKSFYSPFIESLEEIKIVFYRQPRQPKHNPYIFFFAITNQFVQVYFGIRCIRITCTFSPAFIHNNIWNTKFRSKINVILISIQVITRNKIHIRSVRRSVIPPFPAHLSRFNP